MKNNSKLHFILTASLFPFLAFTQEIKQEKIHEIIITENRLQIPFSKNNRNIEIITAEEIQALPAKSLNEVLTFLNGVDIRQRGPFGSQADISIDGGSFEQSLILLNGIKITDPQTAHHSLNLPVPLDAIERIEVLRGAAARIYGINALTGAINIVTKKVAQNTVMANLYAGSSFKSRAEEDKSGVYYGSGAQLGGTWHQDKHQHQFYYGKEKSNGQRYNTASQSDKLHYQGQLQLNGRNEVEWLGNYMYNKFGANGFYAAPGDKESEEVVETFLSSISSKHQLTDKLYLSPRISNRYNEDDYRYFKHDLSKARSRHYSNSLALELNSRYQTQFGDFGLGWETRFEQISSSNIGSHKRNNHGAYAEFRTEKISNFIINVGAYINYNTQYGWQVYPGMDLGYQLDENWKIVVNAGSSQRIPSFTDLYLNQRPGNIGNPELRSEDAWQVESALKYQRNGLTAHIGYFQRHINDFIDWVREDASTPYQPFNMGKNKVNGINSNIAYNFGSVGHTQYQLNLGYNYLDPSLNTEVGLTSKYQLENLKHQAKLLFTASREQWSVSLANRLNQRITNKTYYLADLRVSHNFKALQAYVDLQNILNVTYVESMAIPMPGRWLSVGLKYNWKGK